MKILLITKKTEYCKKIQAYVKNKVKGTEILEGEFGDPMPNIEWNGDYIISFLGPWIIKEDLLKKAKRAINFHPAPPKYPGIGGYNFAIYNKDKEFGVTCHNMDPVVDSGKIIKTKIFPMHEQDTVMSLKEKTMEELRKIFHEMFDLIIKDQTLPESDEKWARKPYTRKDFQELCRITKNMDDKEIKHRIRSTYFPGARDLPYIELCGKKFIIEDK